MMRHKGMLAFTAAMAIVQPGWAQTEVKAPGGFVPRTALSYGAAGDPATAVDADHPLPVQPRARTVTYTDRSGTIAVAGGAQALAPANPARGGFVLQNLSTGELWINSMGAATTSQPSLRIGPGQLYEFPTNGVPGAALSIVGATAGQAFAAREW